MIEDTRLLLRAEDAADLPPLSALLQDAIVAVGEVAFDHKARRLVLLVSRYRWEVEGRSRARTAVRIETVLGLQRRAWPTGPVALDLLSVTVAEDALTLKFAGGATLRARIECVDVTLEDMSAPWPVNHRPGHD